MQVFVTADTRVFKIPAQSEDGSIVDDDNMYSNFVCSSLTSGAQFYMPSVGYSVDKGSKVSDYVVLSYDASSGSGEAAVGSNTRVSIVEKVVKTIRSNGEIVEGAKIYTMAYPGGITVYGNSENYFSSRNIGAGDLIRCDFRKETLDVTAVERVYKKGEPRL